MTAITLKQQKRAKRENGIITATINLLEDSGFLDLKIPAIAEAAGCSVGTVYSHFSSKEDLLLGCASSILARRFRMVTEILERTDSPLERLLIPLFLMWHEDIRNPHHYDLCQLSCNPSVWKHASEIRNFELNRYSKSISEIMEENSKCFLNKVLSINASADQVDQLMLSIAGLSQGIYLLMKSSFAVIHLEKEDDSLLELHLASLCCLLKGWGLEQDNLLDYLRNLYTTTDRFTA